VSEPSEQSKDLRFHEEEPSIAEEELTERILKQYKRIEELYDETGIRELFLAQCARLQTKTPPELGQVPGP
jgi:hypothetical protein